ncbi:MAG: magnesium transporter [Lachnospiraceae bacterium]|nr:magnesium transporter [Lachnospiraceae bacterium]
MNDQVFMDLLQAREYKAVRSILNVMNAVDIAALMEDLEERDLAMAFRLIPKDKAAEVFTNMDSDQQSALVGLFTEKELKDMLDEMFLDDTVDLLEDLPANLVTRILENVSPEKRRTINQLLNYPEDSAGSVMTTEYVSLKKTNTVAEALRLIKKIGIRKETIYTCYVLENRKLLGIVEAKDLLTEDDDVKMEDIMETNDEIISVNTHDDQEEVARLFQKYDLLALPVVDKDGHMVGIITVDDAMDVMEEEVSEDIALMGGVRPADDTYLDTPVLRHVANRIPWLLILMLSATVTGIILTHYEQAFEAIPVLVSFIPMIMDTSGNCGSQASTLIIRGLALEEIRLQDVFKVMFKELRVSLLVGAILAVVNGIRVLIMNRDPVIAIVVGLALLCSVVIAKFIGCMMPMLATRLKLDPALMASPLITTIVDACSITIFFSIAVAILGIAM